MLNQRQAEKRADEIDALSRQCKECKLGQKPIGPKSGCDVRKKLVVDGSEIGWKAKHLFLREDGTCKMFQPRKASIL